VRSLPDATRRLLALPIARFVDALSLDALAFDDQSDGGSWAEVLAVVVASALAPQLRELRLLDDVNPYASRDLGDLSAVWHELAALELLHIRGTRMFGTLGALELPALRSYIHETAIVSREELDAIHAARWPRLEHLELWLGASDAGGAATLDDIARIARGDHTPRLAHLGIVNSELADDAIAILASSPLLPRLRTLDLSRGTMHTRGAAALFTHSAAFAHLEWIDVSENLLSAHDVGLVRAHVPQLRAAPQRFDTAPDGRRRVAITF
jgi:hypothetical protein